MPATSRFLPATPEDLDTLERRFRRLGFSFDIWTDPPGRAWRGFVHDTEELVVLLEGEIEFVVDRAVP